MSVFQSIILGIVQGLTEFIPVSSTAHLIIFPKLLGWADVGLAFDTVLHLGTLTALLIYFRKDLIKLLFAVWRDILEYKFKIAMYSKDGKIAVALLIATVPAGILGYLFSSTIDSIFRGILPVAIFLLLGSVLMFVSERYYREGSGKENEPKKIPIIGLFQCLALLPGFSRSGSTISGGLLLGFSRQYAARVSFLLSIPIILAAGLSQLPSAVSELSGNGGVTILLAGFTSSALAGYFAIKWFISYISRSGLKLFIVYRVILALFLISISIL